MVIIGIGLIVLFVLLLVSGALFHDPTGEDCSMDTHRRLGKYRVLYSDGYLSQPLMRDTAQFYAAQFGGRVVDVNNDGPYKKLNE